MLGWILIRPLAFSETALATRPARALVTFWVRPWSRRRAGGGSNGRAAGRPSKMTRTWCEGGMVRLLRALTPSFATVFAKALVSPGPGSLFATGGPSLVCISTRRSSATRPWGTPSLCRFGAMGSFSRLLSRSWLGQTLPTRSRAATSGSPRPAVFKSWRFGSGALRRRTFLTACRFVRRGCRPARRGPKPSPCPGALALWLFGSPCPRALPRFGRKSGRGRRSLVLLRLRVPKMRQRCRRRGALVPVAPLRRCLPLRPLAEKRGPAGTR